MQPVAVCPGSFDPVTNGHLDIISRSSRSFGPVVVAVLDNPAKRPLFEAEERVGMLKVALADAEGVEVDSFSGLLVDYARRRGLRAVVKGLRAQGDFEAELRMAHMNRRMGGVETFFLPSDPKWSYLSSSLIKEVVRLGGDVSGLVPPCAVEPLRERLRPFEG